MRIIDWILSKRNIGKNTSAGSLGLLILRVGVGLMMALGHGWGKLQSYGENAAGFPDPLGIGSPLSLGLTVFAEFFCSLALALGLFTRAAVIPLMITMLVAALVIHGADPWGKKEMATLYFTAFATIFFAGPGKYSLDRLFVRK